MSSSSNVPSLGCLTLPFPSSDPPKPKPSIWSTWVSMFMAIPTRYALVIALMLLLACLFVELYDITMPSLDKWVSSSVDWLMKPVGCCSSSLCIRIPDRAEAATATAATAATAFGDDIFQRHKKEKSPLALIEFVYRPGETHMVGSGRAQTLVSMMHPHTEALNNFLIDLEGTRKLRLHHASAGYSVVTREEIEVDREKQIFARVIPFGNAQAVDDARQWIESRASGAAQCPALSESMFDNTGYVIFLYSYSSSVSQLNEFCRDLHRRELQRRADQLGQTLYYFKEVGSAAVMAEVAHMRALAAEQIQAQMMGGGSGGGNSGSGGGLFSGSGGAMISSAGSVETALKHKTQMSSMMRSALGGAGGGSMPTIPRPFLFMMTPFHTNKRMGNLVGKIFQEISRRVRRFSEDEAWYIKRGQPYTFGLLLHGPPGCGKTSLVKALAKDLQRHIFDMTLHPGTTQKQMFDFFHDDTILVKQRHGNSIDDATVTTTASSVMSSASAHSQQEVPFRVPMDKRLLVFDDFTAGTNVFRSRDIFLGTGGSSNGGNGGAGSSGIAQNPFSSVVTNGNDPLTLQFMLNLYDGVLEQRGRLSVFNDNHPELIDRAMLRPGRIDMIVELGFLGKECTIEYVCMFFECANARTVEALFQTYEDAGTPFVPGVLTGAELQRVLMNVQDKSLAEAVHHVVHESILARGHCPSSSSWCGGDTAPVAMAMDDNASSSNSDNASPSNSNSDDTSPPSMSPDNASSDADLNNYHQPHHHPTLDID